MTPIVMSGSAVQFSVIVDEIRKTRRGRVLWWVLLRYLKLRIYCLRVRALLGELPGLVVAKLDRWVLDLHLPEDIDGDAVCLRCQQVWPCDVTASVLDRRDQAQVVVENERST